MARAECLVEEMAEEEMKIVEKHRVRWADMDEDMEMERVVTVEEREEQREIARCGELEMAEERKWEGKAVQDVEVAAMKVEEREREDKAVLDGEMAEMKAEKREWKGKAVQERELAAMKAVQDGELAAMEERERERQEEKNRGGVHDAEGGTERERGRTGGNGTKFGLQMCVLSAAKRFFSANAGMGLRGFE